MTCHEIMVIEDEPLIGDLLKEMLEGDGYRIEGPFTRLAEAWCHIQRHRPEAAVLDWTFPDGSARELVRFLTAADVPFLILSGWDRPPDGTDIGTAKWISKPVSGEVICRAVRELCAGKDETNAEEAAGHHTGAL